MKAVFSSSVVIIAAMLMSGAVAQAPDLARMDVVERSVPNGPVAFVDRIPISRSRFLLLYRNRLLEMAMQSGGVEIDDLSRGQLGIECLRQLLEREVLSREGIRRGFEVTDAEIDSAYQAKLRIFQEGLSAPGEAPPDEAAVLEFAGQTKAEALDSMRRTLLANKVWEALAEERDVAVSDDEIGEFYRSRIELFRIPAKLHLEQIFIRPKPAPTDTEEEAWQNAKARADKALARIRAGESFAAVARDVSDAPDRDKGGDIGMAPADQLPALVAEAAQPMKPGELSGVIRSVHGFHLFRLVDREDSAPISLEVARPRIEALLRDAKTELIVGEFCQPVLADPARVRVFLRFNEDLMAAPEEQPPPDAS